MTKIYGIGDKVQMPFHSMTLRGKVVGIGTNGRPVIRWQSGAITTPSEETLATITHA